MTKTALCGWYVHGGNRHITKTLLVMKLTVFLLTAAFLNVSAKGVSQNVTLSGKNLPLEKVFAEVKKQTGYFILYSKEVVEKGKPVNIEAADMPLSNFLDLVFKDQPLSYIIDSKTINISPYPVVAAPSDRQYKLSVTDNLLSDKLIDVTGFVKDHNGNPLPGANIKIRGTNNGTTTNADGSFLLKDVDGNSVLEVSYVGFETTIVSMHGRNSLVINLNPKNSILDETIVIAYGTTTNRLSTGNVSKVRASEIEKQPVNNPLLALQGRVPGVQITQTSGLPGAGVVVRIQGQNSLKNGNNPLYVVDGVPISTEIPSAGQGYAPFPNSSESYIRQGFTGRGNTLSFLNPSDIESIEILKDADATSIYGSRAANGAILITTKRGKAGKASLSVNAQHGFGQVGHFMKLLNTEQYVEMRNEALKNEGLTPTLTDPFDPGYAVDLLFWDTLKYTNWQKELIGGSAQYTHVNASISGGTSEVQYLVSGNYHKETTVFPGNYSNQRGAMHLSLNNNDAKQKFHFQLSTNYTADENQLPRTDLTEIALVLTPNAPSLYNADHSLNWAPDANGNSTFVNPLSKFLYRTYDSKSYNLIANGNLSYDILPGLRISSNVGFTNLQSTDNQTNSLLAETPEDRAMPSTQRFAFYATGKLNTWIIEPQASYNKIIGKGKLDALAGSSFQRTLREATSLRGIGFNNDQVMTSPNAASTLLSEGYIKTIYKYTALFGRFNYTLKDKYILNLTGRRDGSTRFGANSKFHNFWSAAAGWIFSEEEILKKQSVLSFGKLKLSYGTSGSDQIGDYRFLTLYNTINPPVTYQGTTGLTPNEIPNPYLQWEETKKLSVGLDLGFFNNRIFFASTYNYNRSSNQLLDYFLPRITGRSAILRNFPATIENTNLELSLQSENIKTKKFSWISNINLTIPRNKLLEFPNIETSPYDDGYIVGKPISLQKLYHYSGVDPTTGLYTVADNHGDPTTSPVYQTDRTVVISNFSKFYGGFSNTFHYKSIQLDVLIQFVKQIAPSPDFGFWFSPGEFYSYASIGNQPAPVMNRWQKPGDDARIQKFTSFNSDVETAFSNVLGSDAYYTDASYARLKNLSLSWELPQIWKQKTHLQNCRLFIQGQNLLTITKYKGLDPETLSYSNLPPLRVVTFGIQLKL